MTIIYGHEELARTLRELELENQKYQQLLTSTENVEDMRVFAHRQMFCELFAEQAPSAWASLLQLQVEVVKWIRSQFFTGTEGPTATDAMWQRVPAEGNITGSETAWRARLLELRIQSWALQHGIDVPWVRLAALKTIQAISYFAAFDADAASEDNRAPSTLLFDDFPVLLIEGGDIEIRYARQQSEFYSRIYVDGDLGVLIWDSLAETRSQFRKRAAKRLDAQIERQLNKEIEVAGVVAGRNDLEVHAHHMTWTIQRYAGKRSIRSLHHEHDVARPAISKAIHQVAGVLGLQVLPQEWGATSAKIA